MFSTASSLQTPQDVARIGLSATSTPVLADQEVRTGPATVRPYRLGGLAALCVGAAAIHFEVVFEHFAEYTLCGVFFLVISWAQVT